jgi:ABC-type phosphate transport system permease subunit
MGDQVSAELGTVHQPEAVEAVASVGVERVPVTRVKSAAGPYRLPLATSVVGLVVALLTLLTNATDAIIAPLLLALAAALGVAIWVGRSRTGVFDRPAAVIAILALASAGITLILPTWVYGFDINGIVHRTVVSGSFLFVLSTAALIVAVRRVNAASPSGQDLALVPLFVVPILLGLVGFAFILGRITVSGLSTFRLGMLTTAWGPIEGTGEYSIGYLNNILGTFLLLTLTLLFAFLPGVGAGVFMSEYPGRVARLIGFSATMLRAISIFIIGAAAIGVVRLADVFDSDSFLSLLIRGGWDDGTRVQAQRGSFVMAAVFLALLVMPVIARLTEQGLRSAPREMREGSVALGATDGYGLRRILLPWAAPNILTALILAGAEAAGGLAVIWFMAGTGEHGIGPLSSVTDMDFAVFAAVFGPRDYALNAEPRFQMIQYQDTAALLLMVLTIGLTLLALLLQRRFAARYRGSITV